MRLATHKSSSLAHKTVFEDASKIAVRLPLSESLQSHHLDGNFPLIEDPRVTKRALIIGMFVLRPAKHKAFVSPIINKNNTPNMDVYNDDHDWAYNFKVRCTALVLDFRFTEFCIFPGRGWGTADR